MSEEEEQQEQADPAAARADGPPLALQLLDDFLVMEQSRKAAAAAKKKAQRAADMGDQPEGNRKRITSKPSVGEKGAQDVQPESSKKQRKGGAGDESVSARRHSVPDEEKAQHGKAKKDAKGVSARRRNVPDDEMHGHTRKDAKGVSARRHTVSDDEETTQTGGHDKVSCRIDDESTRNTYRVRWGKQSKGFKYQPRDKQSKKAALQAAKEFAESCHNA